MRLVKRIPMGAGLGGGSSDAGAAIRFLMTQRATQESRDFAVKLGADVPFFLDPTPTWVTGTGDIRQNVEVTPEVFQKLTFLLVLLPHGVQTKAAFKEYRDQDLMFSQAITRRINQPLGLEGLRTYLAGAKNDLESVATQKVPLIGEVLSELRQLPALYAGMTGSGSTCFAVFDQEESFEKSAQELQGFLRSNNCRSVKAGTFRQS